MCAVSVHVSFDKWVFTLNPSMKYRCWKTAMNRFYTEIVLQLITSGSEETNKAVKTHKKRRPSGIEFKLKQTKFTVQGVKVVISVLINCTSLGWISDDFWLTHNSRDNTAFNLLKPV